jgi:ABC-type nitrate/sulfonate/bicarbonate transport system permease component
LSKFLKSFSSIIVLALIWHICSKFKIVDPEFFPSPFDIIKNLFHLIAFENFSNDIWASFSRVIISAVITIPVAILVSLACVQYKLVDIVLRPVIAFTYPLPKVAIIPLLMLIFGIGDKTKIAVISLGMFYLIFINLYSAMLKLKSSALNDVAIIYKIKKTDYLFQFLIKGSWLEFLIGLKLALGYALTLVVVSEFSMSKNGIGNFIWRSWDQFKVIDMYSGVFFLSFVGFSLYFILDILIAKSTKYYYI